MKRIFDTIVIFDSTLDEAGIDQKIHKIEGVIKNNEGEITKTEKWGKRKLAYEVKKKNEGYYVYFFHNSAPTVVEQLETLFRFDENVLKSLTIQVDQVNRSRFGRKKNKKKKVAPAPEPVSASTVETGEGTTHG